MHSNLFPFCTRLRALGIRVTILSTGLLLERDAPRIVRTADDVIVSLDGPPEVHDRIRCVLGVFDRLMGWRSNRPWAPAGIPGIRKVGRAA
jgi:Fe-coproporphyrin III synthase